ncbi:hypothetical protein WA026_008825 [Henosepilachna vigintioctopunctata]|uniref:FAM193 C-terminal domain-containing protein n=1 Tax=Henosepilachna vigintioctopunctata TaxID=420089 RepID=A0AAW1VBC3_9CUCU
MMERTSVKQTESDEVSCKKEYDKADKKILLEFFTYLNEKKSELTQQWLCLQHYMHYIYRTLTSTNPQIHNDEISEYYIAEMKSLVKILSEADEIQLYLRIFSILQEYVTFAFWQYSKPGNQGPPIERLHRYYLVFLQASRNIYPVFLDLEKLLKEKCNMTWIDYSKFVFFNYFYDAIDSEILTKIRQKEIFNIPAECNPMVVAFGELNTLWQTLKNLRGINENIDKEMSEDHKQILKRNFWIYRTKVDEKQNVQRLAAELIILAIERGIRGSDPLLDKNGQCLCEDCLIFKLSYIIDTGDSPDLAFMRISPCRYCPEMVELNKLHDHVENHFKCIVTNDETKNLLASVSQNSLDFNTKSIFKDKIGDESSETKINQCLINLLKANKNVIQNQEFKNEQLSCRAEEMGNDQSCNNETKENFRIPSVKIDSTNKNASPCSHSCKHEEELKAELKKLQGVCDHHKDSKRCDCTYCEVFGSTVANHSHKTNETRNRLRIRLNQRKQKMVSKNPLVDKTNKMTGVKSNLTIKTNPNKVEAVVQPENSPIVRTSVVKSVPKSDDSLKEMKITADVLKPRIFPKTNDNNRLNDIHGLVDYIEGNSGTDKAAIAEKKAAKKARQRQKKEEERKQVEKIEKQREEEKKREEEAKSRLLKQEREKNLPNEVMKKNSKKKNRDKVTPNRDEICQKSENSNIIEEMIPAMVTIKRSMENGDNRPTVTITLKGSTPDQDKLLYTLVNGNTEHNKKDINYAVKSKKNKKQSNAIEQKTEHLVKLQVLRKDSNKGSNGKASNPIDKEVKVSFTVNNSINDKSMNAELEKSNKKHVKVENKKNTELDLPFLRLPPGITITKVDGSLSNKNYKITMNDIESSETNITGNNKSGVIVVDTEKLIHTNGISKDSSNSKRNKKKKNKKQQTISTMSTDNSQPSMVTLKNPIFQNLTENVAREREPALAMDIAGASCGQASIFKNENGMVTIRSSRLQQSLNNGIPMHNLLSDLKPVLGGDVTTAVPNSTSPASENTMSVFNAQEILSGLPGIEITKVDKKNSKADQDSKVCQVAQVSIIPTNGDKCGLDKDDWIYDNIFTPKDVLEDDLDAEERELEAFKRFCQQSVPPKQKEKVAHLNVKDIVLKKKSDLTLV